MQTEQRETISIDEIHENFNIRIQSNRLTSKVKPNDLKIDSSYQRQTSSSKVNAIIRNYNPKAIGVITLSMRENGDLYIIDGAHRVEALKKMNLGEYDVNSIVYFELSLSDEAELFVLFNNSRTKPKRSDLHKAAVIAGDANSILIDQMLERNGLRIENRPTDGVVRAIGTLHKVGNKIGIDNLEKVVKILRDAYGPHSSSFQSELLTALSMIVIRYKNVDIDRLTTCLSQMGKPTFIISKAANLCNSQSPFLKYQTLALMIIEQYNMRLRAKRLDRSLILVADSKNYLNG